MTNTSNNVTKHWLLLTLLALSLSGCASPSPGTSVERAKAPKPNGELMKSPRSLKASSNAQRDIKKWHEMVNSTQSK